MDDNHGKSFRLNFAVLNALVFLTMRPINTRQDCFKLLIALTSAGWPLWLTGKQKTFDRRSNNQR